MKISVSVPDVDVAFVDTYAAQRSTSRSAVIHAAIEALRRTNMAAEYEAAFNEWAADAEAAAAWNSTTADGLS